MSSMAAVRTTARWQESAVAVGLSGAVGAGVDWLILLSQFTQRGDVSPLLPPGSLVGRVVGLAINAPAVLAVSRTRPRPLASSGISLLGTVLAAIGCFIYGAAISSADVVFTLLWCTPLALVLLPAATLVAAHTGARWKSAGIVALVVGVVVSTGLVFCLAP